MADTEARGIAPPQRQDVTVPGLGFGTAPGVSSRALPIALPGTPAPDTSAAQSLLRALDVSTGNLDAFGPTYLKEDREQQFKEGQMKAQESQKSFADAQAQGVIPQAANPWFIKGYQNQDGRVQGLDYYTAMSTAYVNSAAKGNDDPAAYDKFLKDFKQGYMGKLPADRSTDWWDGFKQTSGEADARMAREHADDVHQSVLAKQATNTGAEVNTILNSTRDPKVAAAGIEQLREKMRLDGMAPQDFDKVTSAQVLAKAKLGDASMLAVLDHVKTDAKSGATLASDAKVAMAKVDVQQFLTDKARSAQQFAWAADNHAYTVNVVRPRAEEAYQHQKTEWDRHSATWNREDQSRSLISQIQTATIAHPESALAETRPMLAKLAEVNPLAVEATSSFVRSYISGTDTVPAAIEAPVAAGFRDRIIQAAGDPKAQQALMLDVNDAIKNKTLNRATFNDLFIFSERMAQFDPEQVRKLNSPELNDLKSVTKGRLMNDKNNVMGNLFGGAAQDYNVLVDAINNSSLEYLKKNPNASAQELRENAEKVVNGMIPSVIAGYGEKNMGQMEKLGTQADKAASAPAPTTMKVPAKPKAGAAPPTDMEKHLLKLHPADKVAVLRDAAMAHRKGPQAFAQFLSEHDQALGVPGITAAIIGEANSRATAPPPKR